MKYSNWNRFVKILGKWKDKKTNSSRSRSPRPHLSREIWKRVFSYPDMVSVDWSLFIMWISVLIKPNENGPTFSIMCSKEDVVQPCRDTKVL